MSYVIHIPSCSCQKLDSHNDSESSFWLIRLSVSVILDCLLIFYYSGWHLYTIVLNVFSILCYKFYNAFPLPTDENSRWMPRVTCSYACALRGDISHGHVPELQIHVRSEWCLTSPPRGSVFLFLLAGEKVLSLRWYLLVLGTGQLSPGVGEWSTRGEVWRSVNWIGILIYLQMWIHDCWLYSCMYIPFIIYSASTIEHKYSFILCIWSNTKPRGWYHITHK